MSTSEANAIRSIVLIDDDEDFLHVMKRRLRSTCLEYSPMGSVDVHTFNDPLEALVNLPAERICVIIVDYNLPGSTGLEWMPKLINAGLGPVLLMTNQTDTNVTAEAFRIGASDYLSKSDVMADEKRAGRAIREAVQHYRIEAKNQNLTRQLKILNAELAVKNKRLIELTETAHRFVDDVAHDFRTPLAVIQQYASIVACGIGGKVSDDQQSHLATITEATTELAEMVDDFLDSSKLRSGALPVYRQEHTVTELFQSVKRILEVRAATKNITIEFHQCDRVPPFFADLSKVGRIVTNLAINAIKFSPSGSKLHLWSQTTESGDVEIGVTDHGPGILPDELTQLFGRFAQLNQPQETRVQGFGLGLSIVKQLTWLNLGDVRVESEPGRGSTFSFTLPASGMMSILPAYIVSAQRLEEPGDFRLLRIKPSAPGENLTLLRRLVSSFCHPMDIVLADAKANILNVIGVSRDGEAWKRRVEDEITKLAPAFDLPADFKTIIDVFGPWPREMELDAIKKAIVNALNTTEAVV